MKGATTLLILLGSFGAMGQIEIEQRKPIPTHRTDLVGRTAEVIDYRRLTGSIEIGFRGTSLLPQARGTAVALSKKKGAIDIDAEFTDLQPAGNFSPEYLTYVLWAITREGRTVNLGEVLRDGTKSKLKVTTDRQVFGLVVTAEPYFAVTEPNDVVVMENEVRAGTAGEIEETDVRYELLPRGQYVLNVRPADVRPMVLNPEVPLELYEARNAVQIARWTGAERYAPDTLKKATDLLQAAEDDQRRKAGKKEVVLEAREAVQAAEDARVIAIRLMEEERAEKDRRAATPQEGLALPPSPLDREFPYPRWCEAAVALRGSLFFSFDAKVVGQGKEGRCKACVRFSLSPVNLRVHHAVQRNVAVLDDDVNRRNGHSGVLHKVRVVVNSPRDGNAQLVVIIRCRQDFEVVFQLSHARNASQQITNV